jgi:hypothetical protein
MKDDRLADATAELVPERHNSDKHRHFMAKLMVDVKQAPAFWGRRRNKFMLSRLTAPLQERSERIRRLTPHQVETQISGNGFGGAVP